MDRVDESQRNENTGDNDDGNDAALYGPCCGGTLLVCHYVMFSTYIFRYCEGIFSRRDASFICFIYSLVLASLFPRAENCLHHRIRVGSSVQSIMLLDTH